MYVCISLNDMNIFIKIKIIPRKEVSHLLGARSMGLHKHINYKYRTSTMTSSKVLTTIVDKINRVDKKSVKVTGV